MPRTISDCRIIITGASQGIGRALAVEAARRGARVLAVARSGDQLAELADQIRRERGTVQTVVADISKPPDRGRRGGRQSLAGPLRVRRSQPTDR